MQIEYKVMRFAGRTANRQLDIDSLEQDLNKLGNEGWDLVNVSIIGADTPIAAYAMLKRPKN
ncbi:MAG: DUF4177 domain-containing protein [Gammaproteobacteria bacterium]|nr:DUF4177 domain-containing protein [Gammaproteobacteria bacterium]MBU6508947.1 DUF4177 domain-containing protein [Gammaproteobacteria bacterium]MDE1983622.1 DUF4177 domain-containing protein [Gammaproteobacteria bacterium]MDE2109249.1 DUF4177 domain-containing protein [Gammaproteobacteria bacterium]MDE2459893.1 DUF4177 domain-containing protein [Gammaproteobacteria bacterium]